MTFSQVPSLMARLGEDPKDDNIRERYMTLLRGIQTLYPLEWRAKMGAVEAECHADSQVRSSRDRAP